jgi:hypothetical protein
MDNCASHFGLRLALVGIVALAFYPIGASASAPSSGSYAQASAPIVVPNMGRRPLDGVGPYQDRQAVTQGGHLSSAEGERLETWLRLGIRFRGPWQPEELILTLNVLEAFGEALGQARFAAIVRAAVAAKSFGLNRHLILVRKSTEGLPAAVWYDWRGQIAINDSLFDPQFVYENYSWSFLHGPYATPPREIPMQEVIIGHELGHVLIDGLNMEARQTGHKALSLEQCYREAVPPHEWPHVYAVANENLATELAVWALRIERTDAIRAYRVGTLALMTQDAQWAPRIANSVSLAVAER